MNFAFHSVGVTKVAEDCYPYTQVKVGLSAANPVTFNVISEAYV